MELRPPKSDEERGRSPAIVRAFLSAVVEVATPQGVWTVAPDPKGKRHPPDFPTGVRQLLVVTAANPGGQQRPDHINDVANTALRKRLDVNGILTWPALGRSPSGDWGEQSLAMQDVTVADGARIARACEQAAMFLWTPGVLSVVWTPPTGIVTADMRFAKATLEPRKG